MRKLFALICTASMILLIVACGNQAAYPSGATERKNAAETSEHKEKMASDAATGEKSKEKPGAKILVAYYSATGSTKKVAEIIAKELSADTFVITPAKPYTNEDLNYNNDNSRVVREHNNPDGRRVDLEKVTPDGFESYDVIFIGYPIWWGDAAWVVDEFVKRNNFTGKKVIPFCTSIASGLGESGEKLAAMAGTGDWQNSRHFSSGVSDSEVKEWLSRLDL